MLFPMHFISAANGLGMVLAEKGTLDQAKDVFARVREVSAEVLGDVWINLAHVYLAQNKHNEVSIVHTSTCAVVGRMMEVSHNCSTLAFSLVLQFSRRDSRK